MKAKEILMIPVLLVWETLQGAAVVACILPVLFFGCIYMLMSYIVDWARTGDPFANEYGAKNPQKAVESWGNAYGVIHDGAHKRERKLCPVCKRYTYCKVQRAQAGYWLHVQRG